MRIAEPARRHGVSDNDVLHAVRTVVRKVMMDDDLSEIAVAADAARENEARLREAVRLARAQGRSWNQIAVALGVSRQAARQRFADRVGA